MKLIHGSLNDEMFGQYKGWITGAFLPESTPAHDTNIEIKVDYFKGDESIPLHHHSVRKTWTIVLQGCMHMMINNKLMDIRAQEFVIFEPGVTEQMIFVDPGTITISIHTPSTGVSDKVEILKDPHE